MSCWSDDGDIALLVVVGRPWMCAKITAFPSREIQGCFAESTLTMCNFVFKHADLFVIPVACYLHVGSEAKPCFKKRGKVTLYHCNANPLVQTIFFAHLLVAVPSTHLAQTF